MNFITRDKEAGNVIEVFATECEAFEAIEKYENDDREEGIYQEDFYEVAEFNE